MSKIITFLIGALMVLAMIIGATATSDSFNKGGWISDDLAQQSIVQQPTLNLFTIILVVILAYAIYKVYTSWKGGAM